MKVSANKNKDYFMIPEGLHAARCVLVAGLGEQPITWNDETKFRNKVVLAWELPYQRHEFNPEDGEKPAHISKVYTASLDNRAILYQHLKSWRGRDFTDEELDGFELKNVLGAPCQILVKHDKKGDKTYANIHDVMKADKGAEIPEAEADLRHYDPENHSDSEFDALPNWMKERVNRNPGASNEAPPVAEEEEEDEIPF